VLLNKLQVLGRIPQLEMSFNSSDEHVYRIASTKMKDVYSSMERIGTLTTLHQEDVQRMRNKTLLHLHRVLTVMNQVSLSRGYAQYSRDSDTERRTQNTQGAGHQRTND
jgi:hypothetical protein